MGLLAFSMEKMFENLFDAAYFVDNTRSIRYWNSAAEKLTGYLKDEVLGHKCSDNILVHCDEKGEKLCTGNCPLSKSCGNKIHSTSAFLHHKDGHRIPLQIKVIPYFDSSGKEVGMIELFRDNSETIMSSQEIEKLRKQAMIDALTEIPNRHYFQKKINEKIEDFNRYGTPFGFLYLDIDHFKAINDKFGHTVGDKVLKMVAKTIEGSCRSADFVARMGGEEFSVLLSNVDNALLLELSERTRALVESAFITEEGMRISATISIGATIVHDGDTADSIIGRADNLLYECKQRKRNSVISDCILVLDSPQKKVVQN